MMLGLVLSAVVSATPAAEPAEARWVPWYVPRSFSVGFFFNNPVVTPHFRLAWEGVIINQPRNELIWTFTAGSGVGLGLLSPMKSHYQHAFLVGLGYRSDRPLLHWGFHVASGPLWYRADYQQPSAYAFEDRVLGSIEGRLQLGLRLAGPLKLAAYFGFASPFVFNQRFPGNTYVGGIDAGVLLDWR
jgi:hypothetical protein